MRCRVTLFILLFLNSLGVYSQISANISYGCAPMVVNFTPPPGMNTYYWDFDDGSSSTDANPKNTFINPKMPYEVTLRECKTCPIIATYNVNVSSKPSISLTKLYGIAPFEAEIIPDYKLPVNVQMSSIKYIFGDGSSLLSTNNKEKNIYNSSGVYPVTIELNTIPSEANCDNSFTLVDAVTVYTIDLTILAPRILCEKPYDLNVSPFIIKSDYPIISYLWDFGDGNTSTDKKAKHTYQNEGNYTVKLTVTDSNNIKKTVSSNILVSENNLSEIISEDTICMGESLEVARDGKSILRTNWVFPGAVSSGSNTDSNTSVTYSSEGLKILTVNTTILGRCPKKVFKNIYVLEPKIDFTISPYPFCDKSDTFYVKCNNPEIFDSIHWVDDLNDTVLSKKFTDIIPFTLDDLDTIEWYYPYERPNDTPYRRIQIRGFTKYGCDVTIDTIVSNPLIAHVVPTTTLGCAPLIVGFYDKTLRYRPDSIIEWKLIYGDGSEEMVTDFPDTIYHTYNSRGVYDMRMVVKNIHGCIDTTYVNQIRVGSSHAADFEILPNSIQCASDTSSSISLRSLVNPSDVNMTKFWADGFQCYNQDNVTFKPNITSGTFPIVMEVLDNGCHSSISKDVTVNGPIAKFRFTQNCDSINKVDFINISQEATRFLWKFSTLDSSIEVNPSYRFSSDGIYEVTLTAFNDNNLCPPSQYTKTVQIETPHAELDRDTFIFCNYDIEKIVKASKSSGHSIFPHTGFSWEFSGGKPPFRTFENFMDYYGESGSKIDSVYLTVRNFMNCKDRDTSLIIVDFLRADGYTVPRDTLICPGDIIQFDTQYRSFFSFDTFQWDFGDGNTSNSILPSHSFNFDNINNGIFLVKLKVTNTVGCLVNREFNVRKLNLGLALDIGDKNICISSDSTIIKARTSVETKKIWTLPDGSRIEKDSFKFKFLEEKSHDFFVYVEGVANSNCKDSSSEKINAWNSPNIEILSDKDSLDILCDPVNINFSYIDSNNTKINNALIAWSIINSLGDISYKSETVATPLTRGDNTVKLIIENIHGCKDTVEKRYKVFAPRGELSIDTNNICKGDFIEFQVNNLVDVTEFIIDFGDGSHDTVSPVTHRYNYVPLGGSTIAKAIFSTNEGACEGPPVTKEIFIHEVFAKFGTDINTESPICLGPIFFKDSSKGADFYNWDFGDGTVINESEPEYYNYINSGTYTVTLTTENTEYGCLDTFSEEIVLIDNPIANPVADSICLGDSIPIYQKRAIDSIEYYWYPTDIFTNNPTDSNYLYLDDSLTFSLVAINPLYKCSDTATGFVYVVKRQLPIIFDTIIAPGQDIQLPLVMADNYEYIWLKDSFLSCIDCNNPTALALLNPIIYKLVLRDKIKNCFLDTSVYDIDIYPDILVNAPSAFTPNGDGNNDVFYARGFGIKRLLSFKVYNRWGQLLFYSQSEDNGWDGYYKGVLQNSEMYYYTIEAESYIPNKIVTKEGGVMLLR